MKVKTVHLKKFRRFTDLTITSIPETAKLIVLAGPNGCGKSSLFDGFISWHTYWKGTSAWQEDYHAKQIDGPKQDPQNSAAIELYNKVDNELLQRKKALYVRTAYRNDPDFNLRTLSKAVTALDENRFQLLMENDAAVSLNYQRLASQAFKDMFVDFDEKRTVAEFRKHVLEDIRTSMNAVFPDLDVHDLGNPLEDGTFYFGKGASRKYNYKNLSGGEKAAFDLVLDLVVKRREYDDTIFCIDEPELHMNTRLQGTLLQELFKLINEKSQLWIATHSIGMMRKARDLYVKYPGHVIFLDFDQRDYDQPQVLEPVAPNRHFWERVLSVALDDLAELVAPNQVVICEGDPVRVGTGPNVAHDAKCMDIIFAEEFPETKFLAGGNSHDVVNNRHALLGAIEALSKGVDVIRIIDRDARAEHEVQALQKNGVRVLRRRHLESYLFDDEMLTALCSAHSQPGKTTDLIAAKNKALKENVAKQQKAPDDIKNASGAIYVEATRMLALTGHGSNAKEFMRATLAPLMKPGMVTYEDLKTEIFGTPPAATA